MTRLAALVLATSLVAASRPATAIVGLARGAWTWVPFPDSRCDDGSQTGIGVNRGEGDDLVVFLDGGGACWDFETCVVRGASRHGPWSEAELGARAARLSGSLLDPTDPGNPFRRWNLVFVPYCTGDVHSGDRATTYAGPGGERRTLEHRGRANALAFARRIAATFPRARRVVIAGSSGGGYGALVNYEAFRRLWPAAKGYLVDDSGPALRGLPDAEERNAWWAAWGTPAVLETFCPECIVDPGAVWSALSRRWPDDRIALLTSTRDETMCGYLRTDAATFQRAMRETLSAIDPLPNVRAFVVDGETHTMLGAPGRFVSGGARLREWLRDMVADDPAWSTRRPP
jgi:hypothetical protein